MSEFAGERVVCWFSCGATSAVATLKAIEKYRGKLPIEICYCDTGCEHPDNLRFLSDMELVYRQKVRILKNPNFKDCWEVWEKRRYIAGIAGAPCTHEMKIKPRIDFQRPTDIQVFGFGSEEIERKKRFEENHKEIYVETPLIDSELCKEQCFAILKNLCVEIPMMYRMGYRNANCSCCPKGMAGYWNKIRVDFPENFERMAKLERKLNAAINKTYKGGERQRVFLDELDPKAGRYKDMDISCGFDCELEENKNV